MKDIYFTVRISKNDKKLIKEIAEKNNISQSDFIVEAAKKFSNVAFLSSPEKLTILAENQVRFDKLFREMEKMGITENDPIRQMTKEIYLRECDLWQL